jgi:ribosomal protein L7Ae-like RNA K-turn-binding protein
MNNKLMSTVGLCRRAGKTVIGSDLVVKALRAGECKLVLLASDASDNTKKRITDKSATYKARLVCLPISADELGLAVGKSNGIATVAITDESLSNAVLKYIDIQ